MHIRLRNVLINKRVCIMSSLKEFFAILCLIFVAKSSSAQFCPAACNCHESRKVWNCSGLDTHFLQDVSNESHEVKHIVIQDSKIDFHKDLSTVFPHLKSLEVANSLIHCTKNLTWMLGLAEKLKEPENVLCTSPQNLNGTQLLKALQLIHDVHARCPDRCSCELTHVRKSDQYATVSISCNNLGLTELPKVLPVNVAIHMDLSNNRIEDVDELAINPNYKKVTVLYLNNNRIQSISSLENSDWIGRFSLLNLQGNLLQEIPTHALSNALGYTDPANLYLSNNPWKCDDCFSITRFQSFVVTYKQLIKDVSNVTCGPEEGESKGKKIMSFELSSVCTSSEITSINLMDVLNVLLAVLTLLTIGKLLYDYYAYRKTGQLPWIASKLP